MSDLPAEPTVSPGDAPAFLVSVTSSSTPPSRISRLHLAGAVVLALYAFSVVRDPDGWRFIDGVNLLIHEGGHPVFSFFGEFMTAAGGTLMQLLVPVAFTAYFRRERQRFAACVTLAWMGESLFNVARYMADARARLLPLVGGDGAEHDWAYMLGRLGVLEQDQRLANLVRLAGALVLLAAVLGALKEALRPRPASAMDDALTAEDRALRSYLADRE